jgi:hypothetical protein
MKIGKKGIGILVISLLVLALGMVVMMPSVVAEGSGVYFVMEDGSEIPIEQYLMESGGRTADLPAEVVQYTFIGAVLGLIGSTFLPFYFEWRKDKRKFDYTYLFNAFNSAVGSTLFLIVGLPANTAAWYAGVLGFLLTSGWKGLGDKMVDKTRKTVVT